MSDPNLFLDQGGTPLIVDEIQYAPELLSYVKIRIDENRNKKGRYLFTGSQQFHLIKNLGDSLAGRIALLDLLPFSLHEKRHIARVKPALAHTQGSFVHACLYGSYPEPNVEKREDVRSWYGSYIQTYLERDIRSLYDIGSLRDFQQFVRLLAARCAQVLNMSSLASELGVSVHTVKKWISILEASRIIYLLPPYFRNMGKRVTKASKVYFLDCGMVCYLTGIHHQEHLLQGPLAGALYENYCVQETVKTYFNLGMRPTIHYLRTHNQLEIDLLIEGEGMRLYPVEIKLTKTPKISMTSPIERFRKLFSEWEVREGSLLSLSEKTQRLSQNVTAQRLDDYLEWLRNVMA